MSTKPDGKHKLTVLSTYYGVKLLRFCLIVWGVVYISGLFGISTSFINGALLVLIAPAFAKLVGNRQP